MGKYSCDGGGIDCDVFGDCSSSFGDSLFDSGDSYDGHDFDRTENKAKTSEPKQVKTVASEPRQLTTAPIVHEEDRASAVATGFAREAVANSHAGPFLSLFNAFVGAANANRNFDEAKVNEENCKKDDDCVLTGVSITPAPHAEANKSDSSSICLIM